MQRMAALHSIVVTLLVVFAISTAHLLEDDTVSVPAQSTNNDEMDVVETESTLENIRSKRQYYYPAWTYNTVFRYPFGQGYTIWQPQNYQSKRPYVVPIWGSAGQVPFYLPPQPLYINSGFPIDNPPISHQGIPYLPPVTEPPGANDTTTKETDTKFGDVGPVWDYIPAPQARPTRPTKKPGQQVTHPPLVHKESKPGPATAEKAAGTPIGGLRPGGGSAGRPQPPKETPAPGNGQPSRCVWAIISCCSANSDHVSYSCFEQLGCTGAFWGASPCDSEFARSAIAAAMNYYNAK